MSSGDPIELNYLIFDDEDEEINQNIINVKLAGYKLNPLFINPIYFYNAESDTFDMDGFKGKISDKIKGQHISLIATDWNMLASTKNYGELNGLAIIEEMIAINEKFKKCPYLIYSGKSDEASRVLISKIQKEISENSDAPISSLELLSLLLELRVKFCTRGMRFDEIKTMVRNQKTISLIVLDLLEKFENNLVVNTGNEHYDGKKLGDLVSLVAQNDDYGLKFVRELIELSIANYSELNDN